MSDLASLALSDPLALLVNRQCRLEDYSTVQVPAFDVRGRFIAYCSPESTFSVTRRCLDAARKSVLIGIYDFTAPHVKELLLNAISRGVQVALMLDVDGMEERKLFEDLDDRGVEAVAAPSCANEDRRYFASSHEKVIVIDGAWTLIQSGNYSSNSCPFNQTDGGDPHNFVPGNRDMGIAIESQALARFFTGILRQDMQLARGGSARAVPAAPPDVALAAPVAPPPRLFRSKTFQPAGKIRVRPVLTPDNYMDVVPDWIRGARRSILIEQQYIRSNQAEPQSLIQALAEARQAHPGLEPRIVLARAIGGQKERDKLAVEIDILKQFGFQLGKHIRLLSPKFFVHCHNKLVIVDDEQVLISSQNWSAAALTKNREAGVIIHSAPIARFYRSIFDVDWETGLKTLSSAACSTPFDLAALGLGQRMVALSIGDIADV